MKKVAIFHYQPLEKYPPILNLIQQLDCHCQDHKSEVKVFTTFASADLKRSLKNVKVITVGLKSGNIYLNKINYLSFNFLSILYSLVFRPGKAFYYETISCFPPFFLAFFFKKMEVFVHYHEYMTTEEYNRGMWLVKKLYQFEKRQLYKVKWLSHTNKDRLCLFLKQINEEDSLHNVCNIMPNFPPKSWMMKRENLITSSPIRIVYVGYSIEESTSFIREFLFWLNMQDNVCFDAYLYQTNHEILSLEKKYAKFFKIKPAIPYNKLPSILPSYHVGVILYKAHILNYKFNAPNKLFEYLACGLDVWFSEEITGCLDFVTKETYPKVVSLNFKELNCYNISTLVNRKDCSKNKAGYFAENVNYPLVQKLIL